MLLPSDVEGTLFLTYPYSKQNFSYLYVKLSVRSNMGIYELKLDSINPSKSTNMVLGVSR